MLAKTSGTFYKYAKGWLIFVFFLLDTAFMLFILPMTQALMKGDSGGPGPIDLLFFYTPARAFDMVAAYGEYGRSFYRSVELTVDLIYPVVYTVFFALLLSWLFQRGFSTRSPLRRWNVLPLGGWLFDLLENLGIVGMLSAYPASPALLGWVTAGFTLIKWLFAGATLGLIVIGLIVAARNGFTIQN